MPTLPEIRIPMPEEEQPLTLYGRITNTNEPPKYDDIQNSDLPKEEKMRQIQYRTDAYKADVDRQARKDYARIGAGTALSAASFLPIFNIPYVGTGIGGAMYDLGQGIVEGDTAGDLAKRAGRGFVIGETVGAIPYAGKALGKTKAGQAVINSAPVQAVGGALNKAGEKFANSKLYDALMTDIKAFNPNKQTVYHGSPYDFNKFSNEAIGTGEGAQAHGYGHYAALNKDVAEGYRNRLGGGETILYNGKSPRYVEFKSGMDNAQLLEAILYRGKNSVIKHLEKTRPFGQETDELINYVKSIDENALKKQTDSQLYKLSVPKDDVMLREGATFAQQPKVVQQALNELYPNYIPNDTPMSGLFMRELFANQGINRTKDEIRKAISDKLYSKGVKGISYNGGIDGEARVIFNPDDIVIGRKYYNQPNLYEQLTGKQNTGALIDSLYNR